MAEYLDMSLEDIIKKKKKPERSDNRATFRGRGHDWTRGCHSEPLPGPGPTRRLDNLLSPRPKPYYVPQAFHAQTILVAGESNAGAGTKLYISNLDYDVTNEDIRVLFSDVGELKRYSVHCDRSGRSKGTAEVVFMHQSDAVAAMKRYNNVRLDGKPMRLELVGVSVVTPVPVPPMHSPIPPMQKGSLGSNPISPSQGIQGRGRGQARGGVNVSHRGSEKNSSGGQKRPGKVSVDDLDADLERYREQAKRTN